MLFILALLLTSALQAQPDQLAARSLQAKQFMANGKFSEAAKLYAELVQAVPGNRGLMMNLGIALHMAGNDRAALAQFDKVLKLQPNALPALMLSGASYLRLGEPTKAVAPLHKAIALAPGDAEGRQMLIDALLMLNRHDDALPHLRQLAESAPDEAKGWYGLGRVYEALAQKAFGAIPQESRYWFALVGESRLRLKRYSAAFAAYRQAGDVAGAHAALAEIYRATNHPEWATVEAAKEKKPDCAARPLECHFTARRFEQVIAAAKSLKSAAAH